MDRKNRILREVVIKLKKSLKIKGQLKFKDNVYWQIEDETKNSDHPEEKKN